MTPDLRLELLSAYGNRLRVKRPWRWEGRVVEAAAQTVESAGPLCSIGECCEIIDGEGQSHLAEAIGFRGTNLITMPVETSDGIRYGDVVASLGSRPCIEVGEGLIGRVLNALGAPLDRAGSLRSTDTLPIDRDVPHPLDRSPIREPLGTGIRAIDSMLTVGRGQRVGIFGGSGVGKSTLIGMMTRNTEADVIVVGLIGERGREVGEFLEDSLGPEGRKRAVVVVSTSDQTPLLRMRAALAATTIAESFATRGQHVLLVVDSLTRFAMAAREVGLAAGEPPTAKGYTPSVFSRLAKLVERAGKFQQGSITAFYTVLMEGDDQQDVLVDAVRSYLDGHVVLSRALAAQGWYPPIEILDSISRLMPAVIDDEHRRAASVVRQLLSAYARSEDLVRIGAYKAGTDPELDRALRSREAVRALLGQTSTERWTLQAAREGLCALARQFGG